MRIINRFWYDVLDRSLDSIAVWNYYAPTFQVGELTLAAHSAKTIAFTAQIRISADADQALDTARSGRNGEAASLRDLYTRGCKLITGSLPKGDSAKDKVAAVRGVRSQSFRAVQDKGEKLASVWKAINEHRAAMSPPLPPLVVGETDVQQLQSLLGNYAQLLTNVSNKETPAKDAQKLLQNMATTMYINNQRWYQSWQGQFPKDSPQCVALRQIDTGSRQAAPGQGVFLDAVTSPNGVVKLIFDAARANRFTLSHKGPNDAAFTVLADGLKEKTFEHAAQTPGEHTYKLIGRNSTGAGTESVPKVVTVAQQAAA